MLSGKGVQIRGMDAITVYGLHTKNVDNSVDSGIHTKVNKNS